MKKPVMHCHDELLADLGYEESLPMEIMVKWFDDQYSTSKHLLVLYSIAKSLDSKSILEIGFGRSSFVLAKVAIEREAKLTCCDSRDFSYLLNKTETKYTDFINGLSDEAWAKLKPESVGFAFLDYFSGEDIAEGFIEREIENCIKVMAGNGVIAIHDVFDERYKVGRVVDRVAKRFSTRKKIRYSLLPYNYGLGLIYITTEKRATALKDIQIKKKNGL